MLDKIFKSMWGKIILGSLFLFYGYLILIDFSSFLEGLFFPMRIVVTFFSSSQDVGGIIGDSWSSGSFSFRMGVLGGIVLFCMAIEKYQDMGKNEEELKDNATAEGEVEEVANPDYQISSEDKKSEER